MKSLLLVVALLTAVLSLPTQAGKKHKGSGVPETPEYKVVETNALLLTVSIGRDGSTHETFKMTDTTKVILDGAPAAARDLKAGMMARIEFAPDHVTALAVTAKDAPRHPKKHRVG